MLIPNEITTQELNHPLWKNRSIHLSIKRLDQVHPLASGNKFFKLKYNLEQAKKEGIKTLLTFGGAFSNHIYATAAASKEEGFECIGIIRGEETLPLNPTLQAAMAFGMKLQYLDRQSYRRKNNPDFLKQLRNNFGNFYLIPEGGTNNYAVKGTSEILQENDQFFTHIGTSIGTGGTFAGLAASLKQNQKLLGFSSLKGEFIHSEINTILAKFQINPSGHYTVLDSFHFGGYGKFTNELLDFIRWFYDEFGIPLDPVYTGKMMMGLLDLIKNNYFPAGSNILAIHTGGLQGLTGFNHRFGLSLPL
ncbi:1-aminocyclopropane-1-carboxylate deaminase/D-cysteine desulfhydrase [Shivajiella indica]|uniref:1-aminocyclopropane-1-carboxylate deaminase/D-cysteine desulfhydrase n=1 Tax=Shivajiella indica TaxID=872115 RepID=A0ABW5B5T4_9BACT